MARGTLAGQGQGLPGLEGEGGGGTGEVTLETR